MTATTNRAPMSYPFDDLFVHANATSILGLARTLGKSPRTLHRWKLGGIPQWAADEAAIAIGSHPACIWTQQWGSGQ